MANGKKRLPVDLIIARGKKHLSENEIRERRSREVSVPKMEIKAPKYLTTEQKRAFNIYAKKLSALGDVFTHLDIDVLAQYVIAFELYVGYSDQIKKIINKADAVRDWAVIDDIAANCEDPDQLVDLLEKLLRRQRTSEVSALMTLQDKAFKQCLACARELGLTITSRAKIEVPPPPDGEDDEL
jgi:P27 family predicted phage terminase small subunit